VGFPRGKKSAQFYPTDRKKGSCVSAALETVEGDNATSTICQLALTYKKSLLPKPYDSVDGFYKLWHNLRVFGRASNIYLTVWP
jgi:hypothetical protein